LHAADSALHLEGVQGVRQPFTAEWRIRVADVKVQMRLRGVAGVADQTDNLPSAPRKPKGCSTRKPDL
jgi:hypothetical protein